MTTSNFNDGRRWFRRRGAGALASVIFGVGIGLIPSPAAAATLTITSPSDGDLFDSTFAVTGTKDAASTVEVDSPIDGGTLCSTVGNEGDPTSWGATSTSRVAHTPSWCTNGSTTLVSTRRPRSRCGYSARPRSPVRH